MSSQTRKEKDKERRRNEILSAAEELLRKKSFSEITMDEIAAKADLSKGTLYLYFASKKELSLAIHNKGLQDIADRFAEQFTKDYSGLDLLDKMSHQYISYLQENPRHKETMMENESLLFPERKEDLEDGSALNKEALSCHENATKMFSYVVRAIQIGMSDGSIVYDGNPKELAIIYLSSIRGITIMSYLASKGYSIGVFDDLDMRFETLYENFTKLIDLAIANKELTKQ